MWHSFWNLVGGECSVAHLQRKVREFIAVHQFWFLCFSMSCTEFFTKFPTIYDVILSKLNSVLEPYLCALQSFTYSSATQSSTTVELVSGSLEYCMLTSEHLFSDSSLVSSNAVLYPVLLLLERLFVTENEDKYLPLLSITLKLVLKKLSSLSLNWNACLE